MVARELVARISIEDVLDRLPPAAERSSERRSSLEAWVSSVIPSVRAISEYVPEAGMRILEVGSGIGLVSRVLAEAGHEVVALEPSGPGFELADALRDAVQQALGPLRGEGTIGHSASFVEDVSPEQIGRFDLLLSLHVLEHLRDPYAALIRFDDLLLPGGVQVHICPNYLFPYEPHLGRIVVPLASRLGRRTLPESDRRRLAQWNVNFISSRRIKRELRGTGLSVAFGEGLLAASAARLTDDGTFAARHRVVGRAARLLRSRAIVRLLTMVPRQLASPMRFTVRGSTGRS